MDAIRRVQSKRSGKPEVITTKRKHKYNAARSVDSRGMAHPSKVEAAFANMLYVLESSGEIVGLKQQVGLRVGDLSYKPDFVYCLPKLNRWAVVDVKGFEGERFKIICQLWKIHGGTLGRQEFDTLTIARKQGHGWIYREVKR